jgi:hypothetical protein
MPSQKPGDDPGRKPGDADRGNGDSDPYLVELARHSTPLFADPAPARTNPEGGDLRDEDPYLVGLARDARRDKD